MTIIYLVITRDIEGGIFEFSIKYPEDIETKEYHIGDSISLSCVLKNTLPIDFNIQSIEVSFSAEETAKEFTLRNDEGTNVKLAANGVESEFTAKTITEFHGTYKFKSLSFVIGNLKLVYNNLPSSKDRIITVVPVMPTTEIVAKFPSKYFYIINNIIITITIVIIIKYDFK